MFIGHLEVEFQRKHFFSKSLNACCSEPVRTTVFHGRLHSCQFTKPTMVQLAVFKLLVHRQVLYLHPGTVVKIVNVKHDAALEPCPDPTMTLPRPVMLTAIIGSSVVQRVMHGHT